MLIKIIGIGLSGAILSLIIKQYRPEIAIAVPILTAAAITALCLPYIAAMIEMFEQLADRSGISAQHLKIVIKIIGIAYICQFAADICRDAGEGSVAGKVELGGKLLIISLSVPIIYDLLGLVAKIVSFG